MLSSIVNGERRLFGFLGANISLGGIRIGMERVHTALEKCMPCLNDLLVIAQIAVALTTVVYIALKIRKLLRQKQ